MTEAVQNEELDRIMREIDLRRATCQHRWEESDFGKKYWEPGTRQYTCARCGLMSLITMGADHD